MDSIDEKDGEQEIGSMMTEMNQPDRGGVRRVDALCHAGK